MLRTKLNFLMVSGICRWSLIDSATNETIKVGRQDTKPLAKIEGEKAREEYRIRVESAIKNSPKSGWRNGPSSLNKFIRLAPMESNVPIGGEDENFEREAA